MKIGVVYPSEPSVGIGIYAEQMCNVMAAVAEVKSVKVSGRGPGAASEQGVAIVHNVLSDYEKAAHWLNSHCDVCVLQHGFTVYGVSNGSFMLQLVSMLQIPLVTVWHEVSHLATEQQRFWGEAIGRRSAFNVAMSLQAANVLEHVFKIHAERVRVLPYGTTAFPAVGRNDVRKKLGVADRMFLVSFGLLEPSLGIDSILETVSVMAVKNPQVLYCHIGTTSNAELAANHETYRRHLLIKARNLKIERNVVFLDYGFPTEKLVEYLWASDACLFGQTDDALVQLPEMALAMSAGAAIISHPFMFAKEMLGDKMGELARFDNAPELADRIRKLLSDHRHIEVMRQAAGDFGAHFQWDKVRPKYIALLREAISITSQASNLFGQSRSQLLVDCKMPVVNMHVNLTAPSASWSLLSSTIYQRLIGDGRYVADVRALDYLLSLQKISAFQSGPEHPDGLAFAAFALSCWLKNHASHANKEVVLTWLTQVVEHLGANTSLLSNSFMVIALCKTLDEFPDHEKLIAALRKHAKPIVELVTSITDEHELPESLTDKLPSVKIWAYWSAYQKLGGKESADDAYLLVSRLVDRMFEEGFFMSLSAKKSIQPKPKRSEINQSADDVWFTALLCRSMGIAQGNVSLLERAMQCYYWFLGENHIRKSLFDAVTGRWGFAIKGLAVDASCNECSDNLFLSMVAVAHDVHLRMLALE